MKKMALGLAAALISTAAFAQSSPGSSTAPDTSSGSSATTSRSGKGSADQAASSPKGQRSGARVDSNTRTREEGSASVNRRSVTETRDEPSVTTVTRRRTVRSVEVEDNQPTMVRRKTVVKSKKHGQKVAAGKRKKGGKVVVRSKRTVAGPSVATTRRRTVRQVETEEPSVSVTRNRTTVRQSAGASVEQRRGVRQSNDVNVSTKRQELDNRVKRLHPSAALGRGYDRNCLARTKVIARRAGLVQRRLVRGASAKRPISGSRSDQAGRRQARLRARFIDSGLAALRSIAMGEGRSDAWIEQAAVLQSRSTDSRAQLRR